MAKLTHTCIEMYLYIPKGFLDVDNQTLISKGFNYVFVVD